MKSDKKAMSWLNNGTGGALVQPAQVGTTLNGPMDRVKVYHYRVAKGDKCCENCKFMEANKACAKFIQLGVQPIRVESGMVCDLFDPIPIKDRTKESKKTDYEKEFESGKPEGKNLSVGRVKSSPREVEGYGSKTIVGMCKGVPVVDVKSPFESK